MSERLQQGDDPFAQYVELFERRERLSGLVAADATIGQAITRGITVIDTQLAQLTAEPAFAERMLTRLDTTATALEQLEDLREVLPDDQLAETAAPYAKIAHIGLEVAGTLQLEESATQRLTEVSTRLGALLVREASGDEDSSDGITLVVTAPSPAVTLAAPLATPVPSEVTEHADVSPAELLSTHFSERDAVVFVEFLKIGQDLLRARQLPEIDSETLNDIHRQVLITQPKDDAREIEDLKRERGDVLQKITDLIDRHELLGQVLDALSMEDPRLALIDYLFTTLDATQRIQLRHIAKAHCNLMSLLEENKYRALLSAAREQAQKEAAALAEAAETTDVAATSGAPGAAPQTAETAAARETLLADFNQRIAYYKQKFSGSQLKRNERYSPQTFATKLRVPLADALSATLRALEVELFKDEDREAPAAEDMLTIAEFVRAQLYGNARFAALITEEPQLAHSLIQEGLSASKKGAKKPGP